MSEGTRQVVVGLDYETEAPWVWVPGEHESAERMAEGYSSQFAVTVPAALVEEFQTLNARLDALVKQIHEAGQFDRGNNRLGDAPCALYVGEPVVLPRGVIYDDCDACGWSHEAHEEPRHAD